MDKSSVHIQALNNDEFPPDEVPFTFALLSEVEIHGYVSTVESKSLHTTRLITKLFYKPISRIALVSSDEEK